MPPENLSHLEGLSTTFDTSSLSGFETGATQDVSLTGVFSDADGDGLTLGTASSNSAAAVVSVAFDYSRLTVTVVIEDTATVTVTARDSDGNTASGAFEVSVVEAQQQEQKPYADLIVQMYEWRNDPQWVHEKTHTDRWHRALLAIGETVAAALREIEAV